MEQVIFNASGLSPGITHDLKVTYLGNPQSVPLSLNNLVITWGPLLAFGHDSSGATPSISVSIIHQLALRTETLDADVMHRALRYRLYRQTAQPTLLLCPTIRIHGYSKLQWPVQSLASRLYWARSYSS